jgi:hypothetical protein
LKWFSPIHKNTSLVFGPGQIGFFWPRFVQVQKPGNTKKMGEEEL